MKIKIYSEEIKTCYYLYCGPKVILQPDWNNFPVAYGNQNHAWGYETLQIRHCTQDPHCGQDPHLFGLHIF